MDHLQEAAGEFRRKALDADFETARDYDKAILTLAAGAIALSLAFIRDIGLGGEPTPLWALRGSWVSLSISLLIVLTSMVTSGRSIRATYEMFAEGPSIEREQRGRRWNSVTIVLNRVSGGTLVLGIVLLLVFANARVGGIMAVKSSEAGGKVTGGKQDHGWAPPSVPQPAKTPAQTPKPAPTKK